MVLLRLIHISEFEAKNNLLDYNKRIFEKFMQDIEKEYKEQTNANIKM